MEIVIKDLFKNFEETKAINGLSLTIGPGVSGLMGHNGAGKSTLLRLLAGVIYPTKGEIKINGYDPTSLEAKKILFFLSDDPYSPGGASPFSLLSFYSCFYEIDREKFFSLLKETKINPKGKLSTFSKGMKRQIFLILALSVKCQILLIDEGFDGLDPLILDVIRKEIIAQGQGEKIILLSSHNLSSLEKLADRFILLDRGKLGKMGNEEDFSNSIAKYQAVFNKEETEESLKALNLDILSYLKIGRITTFIINEKEGDIEKLKNEKSPQILEKIPLSYEEIFASQMRLAERRDTNE